MRRRGQSKRIMGRSLLCQCPQRAFRLALCINAVLLLGGCGMNYRFCPSGTEKDPSRPFTTCKTLAHFGKHEPVVKLVLQFREQVGFALVGELAAPVRVREARFKERFLQAPFFVHRFVQPLHHVSPKGRASSSNVQADGF